MNPSETRICASEELTQLDREMAQAYRRAEGQMPQIKRGQRAFRKALKSCEGEDACLLASYRVRIDELHGFINTFPPPTQDEAAELATAADAAEEKVARERRAIEPPTTEEPEPIPAAIETPTAPPPVLEAVEPQMPPAEPPASEASASSTDWTGGEIFLVGSVLLGSLLLFYQWLKRVLRRCPSCRRWLAGVEVDRDQDAFTDYRTVQRTATYKNRKLETTGTKHYKEQERVRVVDTMHYMRCAHCDHAWTYSTRSESR